MLALLSGNKGANKTRHQRRPYWKPNFERLEERRLLSTVVDNFEGPSLDPFWSSSTPGGSITFPSTAQVHGGNQSVQFNSTYNTGDKGIRLYHNFPEPTFGRVSVWMYDTGADQSSSNYIFLGLNDENLLTYDYDLGPGNEGSTYYACPSSSGCMSTGIDRTLAWHQFTIDSQPDSFTMAIDGATVYSAAVGTPVDRVTLAMSGPTWRPAWVTYFDDFEFTPHLPDIQLQGLTADGDTELTLTYEVSELNAPSFDVGIYRSSDTAFGGDVLLDTIQITAPADLTVGPHTKTFAIGSGPDEVALPGAGAAEVNDDYYLLAVADPTDAILEDDLTPFAEDNTALFAGVYHATGGDVFLHGNAGIDWVNVSAGSVAYDHGLGFRTYTYDDIDVSSVRVRTHDGADEVQSLSGGKPLMVWAGAGNDLRLVGGVGADHIDGGAGDDDLSGGGGNDTMYGSSGHDEIFGGAGDDDLSGDGGNDTIYGGSGHNKIFGGAGNDDLSGDDGNDTIYGGSGHDEIFGGAGNDILFGGAGDDVLIGFIGDDWLIAGAGNDLALGGSGNDVINLGAGNDTAYGGSGADLLLGGIGNDLLFGNDGNDTLHGGPGIDTLNGGLGANVYLGGEVVS